MSIRQHANQVLSAMQEGAVSDFIAYVRNSNPDWDNEAIKAEVSRMLQVVGYSEEKNDYWMRYFFGGQA